MEFQERRGTIRRACRKKGFGGGTAQHTIDRIERHDGKINAVCVRDFDRGLEAARAADAGLARGEKRPLLGIPMTVKESYNVAGLPTTWGFPEQKDFVPPEDALAISRIKTAGAAARQDQRAVGLGDWQSYNDIYGITNNPYNLAARPEAPPADRRPRLRQGMAHCRSARSWRLVARAGVPLRHLCA